MEKTIGRKQFLKNIEKKIAKEDFDVIKNGHTIFIDTKLVSYMWRELAEMGISIRKKSFMKLSIKINDKDVLLDKDVKHYISKQFLTFGHKNNKEGLLIEINSEIWSQIQKDGFFNLYLSYSLLDDDEIDVEKKIAFKNELEYGEDTTVPVTYADINMKVNVNNINKGNHLTLNIGDSPMHNPMAFFLKDDYAIFRKLRKHFIKDETICIVKKLDLKNEIAWYAFIQNIEINVEPYDIYTINENETIEYFSFFDTWCNHFTIEKNPNLYKIMGRC